MGTVFFVTGAASQCGLDMNVTMKEIISLNLGDQGTRVGSQFWRMISAEHGLSEGGQLGCSTQDQVDRIGVFWEENIRGPGLSFRPRRVDVSELERMRDTMERIRREVERCDTFEGFQICQSIEKTKTMLLHDIKEEYPCKIVNAYSTISQETCNKNKVMLGYLKDYCDSIVLFDDKKIKDICRNQKMNPESEACHLIARVMADVTALFRFPSQVWIKKCITLLLLQPLVCSKTLISSNCLITQFLTRVVHFLAPLLPL